MNRGGAAAELRSPVGSRTDLGRIGGPGDVEWAGAPYLLEQGPVPRPGQPEHDASRIRHAHFQGIHRRKLCLLGISAANQITGGARIPKVSAEKSTLLGVELKYREKSCVRVPLCRPLARAKMNGSGVCHHRQIDRRNRSAISGVGHVAETAGNILVDRNVLVEIHQLAESFNRRGSGVLLYRRVTRRARGGVEFHRMYVCSV